MKSAEAMMALATLASRAAQRAAGDAEPVDPVTVVPGVGLCWRHELMLGLVRAELLDGGLWQRSPHGRPMAMLPIIDSMFARPHDLAVFDVDRPSRVWLLNGSATAQTPREIERGPEAGPLVLWSTLHDWYLYAAGSGALAVGGRVGLPVGAVILDWKAWAPTLLESGRELRCMDVAVAAELDRQWRARRPKKPAITFDDGQGWRRERQQRAA